MKNRFFRPLVLTGIALITAACGSIDKNSKNVEITQIDYISTQSYYYDEDGNSVSADRIEINQKLKCNDQYGYIYLSPTSLGLNEKAYLQLLDEIAVGRKRGDYFKIKFSECTERRAIVSKIEKCTAWSCGKEYATDDSVVWLSSISLERNYLSETNKAGAYYYIMKPLEKDNKNNLWKVKIMNMQTPATTFIEGYLTSDNISTAKFASNVKEYYQSGELKQDITFDAQGLRQGKNISYYRSGNIESDVNYTNDKLNGEATYYHENGQFEGKLLFNNGKDVTANAKIYNSDGKLRTTYSRDSLGQYQGAVVSYYSNGKIQSKANYVNGKPTGTANTYYSNGKLESTAQYNAKGQKHGTEIEYNDNGKMYSRIKYVNGQKRSSERWFSNGKKRSSEQWDAQGYRTGTYTEWYDNGNISYKESYQQGKRVGVTEEYDRKGQILSRRYHR